MVSPNPVVLNGPATATANATDGGSGVASASCGSVDTSAAGSHKVVCRATDNAGNTATATAVYTVNFSFSGFLAPTVNPPSANIAKAGRTYPLKWQLTDANGHYVTALTAVSSIADKQTSCTAFTTDPTGAVTATGSGGTALRYDSTANQYVFNWATPSRGCYTLFVTFSSGQVFPAYFNLS
jgi:hypothetical protein